MSVSPIKTGIAHSQVGIAWSAPFTRPNDTNAYASGDLIANSTNVDSIVAMAIPVGKNPIIIPITGVLFFTTDTGFSGGKSVGIWFFDHDPIAAGIITGADNAAIGVIASPIIRYPGFALPTTPTYAGGGVFNRSSVAQLILNLPVVAPDGFLYALFTAAGSINPIASSSFQCGVEYYAADKA